MSLSNKPLESIDETDLQELLDNEITEGKTLEYKQELPGNSDSYKKEFLYDISSFANASGGYLIYGIKEEGGIPTEICGLDVPDTDAAIRKLENMIRDGVEPRIPGLTVRAIPLHNKRVTIVFRIPRSFSLPHMVKFQNASKFYSRNSAGKYQLDVGELRTAFTLSQSLIDRIRSFRQERLSNIVAQETPVPMKDGAKLVLHILPISAFDPASKFDVVSLYEKHLQSFAPITGYSWYQRCNFDGQLTICKAPEASFAYSYLQTFRNGIIEAVDAGTVTVYQGMSVIFKDYEQKILQAISRYLSFQKDLGVEPPFFIMLSLLGVKGYIMGFDSDDGRSFGPPIPIDRDALLVEEMVEDFNFDPAQVMKPSFDAIWNAAGFPRSFNYDAAGNWGGR